MDAGGVDATVLTLHRPWDPNANELGIEAAADPHRFVIFGNVAVDKAGEPGASGHVEGAPENVQPALHVPAASAERMADGRAVTHRPSFGQHNTAPERAGSCWP